MRLVPALSLLTVSLVYAPTARVHAQPIPACRSTVQATLGADGTLTLDPAQVDNGSSDGSGRPVSLSVSPNSFDCASIGSNPHTVTLSVTSSAQTDTCTSSVTVVAPPPAVTCQNLTVNLDGSGIVTVLPSDPLVSASRVCGGAMQVSFSSSSFTCADVGANATTLTVTIGGESAQCTPTVTVVDSGASTPPVITCGAMVTLPPSDEALLPATLTAPTAVDNCFVAMVSSNAPAAGFPLGDTAVTWTATDPSGNQSSCVQTVRRDCCAPDMGVVDMDMGVVDTDMGTVGTDMGPEDAGAADTGTPVGDAATLDDMGSTATDMGNDDGGGVPDARPFDLTDTIELGPGPSTSRGSSCTAGPSGSGFSFAFIGVCALALIGRRRRHERSRATHRV